MSRKKRKDGQDVSGVVVVEHEGHTAVAGISRSDALAPDLDRYRRHVEHFDLSEAQKTDLLHAVWRIMQSFVDRAFGDDPVQQVRATRERSLRGCPVRPVIDVPPLVDTGEDGADLSAIFSHHAQDKGER